LISLVALIVVISFFGVAVERAHADDFLGSIYLHDEDRLKVHTEARDSFKKAREASQSLWDTMLANHEAGMEAGRVRISESGRIRFNAMLAAIETLPWKQVADCAAGTCDPMPDFGRVNLNVSAEEVGALKAAYQSTPTAERMADTKKNIEKVSKEIQILAKQLEGDPDGSIAIQNLPGGPADRPVSDLIAKFDALFKAFDKSIADRAKPALDALDSIDTLMETAGDVMIKAGLSKGLDSAEDVLDLFKHKNVLDAVQSPIGSAIKRGRAAALPDTFKTALKSNALNDDGQPLDIATVGELLDFLTSEHSDVETIRLELLQHMRKGIAARRGLELAEKKAILALLKQRVEILLEQKKLEDELKLFIARVQGYQTLHGVDFETSSATLFSSLERIHSRYQASAGGSCVEGQSELGTQVTCRLAFDDIVFYTMVYAARVGYLLDAENVNKLEIVGLHHRFSIERSRIGAHNREQLIARGLDSLVVFSEGGITTEDMAGVIRFLQTGLLGVIAVN
jgi:hypothetical protein